MQQIMRTIKKGPKAPNFIKKNVFYWQAAGIEKPTIPSSVYLQAGKTPSLAFVSYLVSMLVLVSGKKQWSSIFV